MLHTTRAIVLKTVKHGDHTRVLKAWTEQYGSRSYVVHTGRKNGVRDAALQALSRLELVVKEDPERELQTVRELRVERPYLNLPHDPMRGAVALFVQEVLYKALRTESADPGLDRFLRDALEVMDIAPDIRNFPVVFLLQLSGHLGFFPESPAVHEDRFDLKEGHFVRGAVQHGHTLGPPISHALSSALDVEIHGLQELVILPSHRRELLDHLLLYYQLHLEGLGEMKSPHVLHQVLN